MKIILKLLKKFNNSEHPNFWHKRSRNLRSKSALKIFLFKFYNDFRSQWGYLYDICSTSNLVQGPFKEVCRSKIPQNFSSLWSAVSEKLINEQTNKHID